MVLGIVVLGSFVISSRAHADDNPVGDQAEVPQSEIGPSLTPAGPAAPVAPMSPADAKEAEHWRGAEFSTGRLVVEILVGAAIGSLTSYLVYNAAGGDVGGAIGGLVAGVVVEPLAIFGVGKLMGGEGKLSYTYIGGLMGFGVAAPATTASPALVIALGEIFMPIAAAALFELTSNVAAKNWVSLHHATASVGPVPVGDGKVMEGATLGFRF